MESSRLPGKPLADICGRPMILWVADRAQRSAASEVVVATDSDEIAQVCRVAGVTVELTSSAHASGSDRIAEVAARRRWPDGQVVVNVQGDEPLLPPALIDQVAALLATHPRADIATLQTPVVDLAQFTSRDTAKIVADADGYALYFSRAGIPSAASGGLPAVARRHIGMYAYRCRSLRELAAAPPCDMEKIERLEQLRALWLGQKIIVADAVTEPPHGVDTPADLERIRHLAASAITG
jgi:3-deoxy-manno-octulosonate cytidylyltransferase (CMP-KDO synthetase)